MTEYLEPDWDEPTDEELSAAVEAFEADDSEIEAETEPEGQGK